MPSYLCYGVISAWGEILTINANSWKNVKNTSTRKFPRLKYNHRSPKVGDIIKVHEHEHTNICTRKSQYGHIYKQNPSAMKNTSRLHKLAWNSCAKYVWLFWLSVWYLQAKWQVSNTNLTASVASALGSSLSYKFESHSLTKRSSFPEGP